MKKKNEIILLLDDALNSLGAKVLVVIDAWRAARRGGWECWNSVTGGRIIAASARKVLAA